MPARLAATVVLIWCASAARAFDAPAYLPTYELALTFDTPGHRVEFRDRITWTNPSAVATDR